MWPIAAQHKRYNDNNNNNSSVLGTYNSLKDPHLNSYFRKPPIRRHLLKANIINKENKIVEELASTKHQQSLERKQRNEFYHLLNQWIEKKNFEHLNDDGLVVSNNITEINNKNVGNIENDFNKKQQQFLLDEAIIEQARSMFEDNYFSNNNNKKDNKRVKSSPLSSFVELSKVGKKTATINTDNQKEQQPQQRDPLLQRLDRMIKTIKEQNVKREIKTKIRKSSLKSSKSCQNVSTILKCDESSKATKLDNEYDELRSSSSMPQLNKVSRPKSSYGRKQSQQWSGKILPLVSSIVINDSDEQSVQIPKLIVSTDTNDDDESLEIKSFDGDSFEDSSDEEWRKSLKNTELNKVSSRLDGLQKSLFERRNLVKNSARRQQIKMTFRYNGLNEATNRGEKRKIKIYQQTNIGGNSIVIFDGGVYPGETFSFEVRPHPGNSFAISIFVNEIRDLRLNTCCEHKHHRGTRLSHFTIVDVVGGKPCINCQMPGKIINKFVEFNHFHSQYQKRKIYHNKEQQELEEYEKKFVDGEKNSNNWINSFLSDQNNFSQTNYDQCQTSCHLVRKNDEDKTIDATKSQISSHVDGKDFAKNIFTSSSVEKKDISKQNISNNSRDDENNVDNEKDNDDQKSMINGGDDYHQHYDDDDDDNRKNSENEDSMIDLSDNNDTIISKHSSDCSTVVLADDEKMQNNNKNNENRQQAKTKAIRRFNRINCDDICEETLPKLSDISLDEDDDE